MRGGPSITARAVALARAELERPHTPTGDPDAERRLYAELEMPARWPISQRLRGWVAARTAFFDEATLAALERGFTQIVILGAGYDGRALRFRKPGVRFFEVDHPATQPDKRDRVRRLGAQTGELTYVAHDLAAGGLAHALADAGHARARQTLFICEGLLMYLTGEVAAGVLGEVGACAAAGSVLALSARELLARPGLPDRVGSGFQRLLLAASGEPRRSLYAAGELERLLALSGFAVSGGHAHPVSHGGSLGVLVLAQRTPLAADGG